MLVEDYIGFQNQAVSPFHVVAELQSRLSRAGFEALSLAEVWKLELGKNYYITHRDQKSLVAFCVREHAPAETGFAILGAHTDSPALRLRLNPWQSPGQYQRLLTELHGSLILRSWLDTPLKLGGVLYRQLRTGEGKKPSWDAMGLPSLQRQLVCSEKALAIIPDLAIHLDREKNNQGSINAEQVMAAILGCKPRTLLSPSDLSKLFKMEEEAEWDGFDLSLAPASPHCVVGLDDEFIVGPRHDDLAMVFCAQNALIQASRNQSMKKLALAAFFDAEETGSTTASGAGSVFLSHCLERIEREYPQQKSKKYEEERTRFIRALQKTFLVSADMAHAFHPSFPDRHDENHRPLINSGLVIKQNCNDRYATTGESAAIFAAICETYEVKTQKFVARQDMGCGSTIGPIVSAQLGCPAVDVGLPMWSMHSARETMGTQDLAHACKAFEAFLKGF
ncbi:MAG: M18 family aminopeptidase [Oligoflexales bacterium]|nr:M18 family aminopeptidase [Oligoflexales bacterium]